MKMALHLGTLRGFGSAAVGRNILTELLAQGPQHEFLLWVPEEWAMTYGIGPESFGGHVTVQQTRPGLLQKMATENIQMRLAMRRFGTQRLFSLGDTSLPGCPVPHLLLVQQAHLIQRASERDFPVTRAFELKLAAMKAYLRAALPTVDRLTVQSETMRRGLLEHYRLAEDRVVVVPSAIRALPEAEGFSRPSPADAPTLCYVASASPHKNHELLPDVLARLRQSFTGLTLRLTLSPASVPAMVKRAKELGVLDAIDFRGSMPHREVLRLMKGSTICVMPSKLESFGFPYYEALALGLPMVAADKAVAREACGAGALYARADDSDGWVQVLESLLQDTSARSALAARAEARFKEVAIGWPTIGARYLQLFEGLSRG